jgi:hypothetical protein
MEIEVGRKAGKNKSQEKSAEAQSKRGQWAGTSPGTCSLQFSTIYLEFMISGTSTHTLLPDRRMAERFISRREAYDMIVALPICSRYDQSTSSEEVIRYQYRLRDGYKLNKDFELVRGKCEQGAEGLFWLAGEAFLADPRDKRRRTGRPGQSYGSRPMVNGMIAMIPEGYKRSMVTLSGPLSWAELPGKIIVEECEMFRRLGRAEPTTHHPR